MKMALKCTKVVVSLQQALSNHILIVQTQENYTKVKHEELAMHVLV